MSYITDIIIIVSTCDEDKISIPNKYFESINKPELSFFDARNSGGDKVLCSCLFLGAFNHIDADEFVNYMIKNKSKFEDPEQIQILIRDEQFERYEIYTMGRIED